MGLKQEERERRDAIRRNIEDALDDESEIKILKPSKRGKKPKNPKPAEPSSE